MKKKNTNDELFDNSDEEQEVDDEEDEENYDYSELINNMGTKLEPYKKNDAQISCHIAINLINR